MSCPICFNEENDPYTFVTLPCNCTACVDCLSQWITLKISENQYTIDSRTACIMAGCKTAIPLQEIYRRMPISHKQKMDEALLQVYFSRQKDIRKCPNPNCKYAGVINMKISCTSPLQCNLCGSTWRDQQHFTKFEKILNYLKNRPKAKAEDLSQAWIKQRSKKCPSCKVNIEKNGGCDHMTCKHCNYEFCWICSRIHPLHFQVLHSYHQNFLPLIAILFIFSAFGLILYSFGIMQTLKFFVSGLAWLISSITILIAKIIYSCFNLSVWLLSQSMTFLLWLIDECIPFLFQFISSSCIFISQFIFLCGNLLAKLIFNSIVLISWLIDCSIPYLVGFISSSFNFIVYLMENSADLLVWLFSKSVTCFVLIIDTSMPFLTEFISSSLTFLILLISNTITFIAWFIHTSIAFISWLIDASVPLLLWLLSSICTVIAQFFFYSAYLFIWLLSNSIAYFSWLVDCSAHFLIECLSSSLTFFIWLICSVIASLAWFFSNCITFLCWLIDCSIPILTKFIMTSTGWLLNGITTYFTSSIFYITQFSSSQIDPANLQISKEFL